jgi:hypothetical protein
MHNAVYMNLNSLKQSIQQLIEDENLNNTDKTISVTALRKHFKKEDDYYQILSNGTWLHIMELNEYNFIK